MKIRLWFCFLVLFYCTPLESFTVLQALRSHCWQSKFISGFAFRFVCELTSDLLEMLQQVIDPERVAADGVKVFVGRMVWLCVRVCLRACLCVSCKNVG